MLQKLVRLIDRAASLVLWNQPGDTATGARFTLDELRAGRTDSILEDVPRLDQAVERVFRLMSDGLKLRGFAIGTGHDRNPVIETYGTFPDNGVESHSAFCDLFGLESRDVVLVKSAPFKAEVTAGDSGKHNALGGYGTVGGFVRLQGQTALHALSNNHVFALCNAGTINDGLISPLPGTTFGKLSAFVNLVALPDVNEIDAAIGLINPGQPTKSYYRSAPSVQLSRRGLRVEKWGATTNHTTGVIRSVYGSMRIDYGSLGEIGFQRAILINGDNGPFSQPGDSGSFVRSCYSNRLLGLHFAGDGVTSVACRIQTVFARLSLRL